MRLFTDFEMMVVRDMIKVGLDPYNKEDIENFWFDKLSNTEKPSIDSLNVKRLVNAS